MDKCIKCGIEKDKSKFRRGMCLNCYREETGFSGGKRGKGEDLTILVKELEKAEQRVRIIKTKIYHRLK